MTSVREEKFVNQHSANDFTELNEIWMKDYNFLPSIEIRLVNNTKENWSVIDNDEEIDLFDKPLLKQKLQGNNPNVDLNKLSKYVRFSLNVRTLIQGEKSTIFKGSLRKCRIDDFESRSYKVDEITKQSIHLRLCPDMEQLSDIMRVKNKYDNKQDRVSFEIMVSRCLGGNCAPRHHAKKVLSTIFFTAYHIDETISYSSNAKRPIEAGNRFHS